MFIIRQLIRIFAAFGRKNNVFTQNDQSFKKYQLQEKKKILIQLSVAKITSFALYSSK